MGIASKTLRKNNMEEEAKEMIVRIEESKSYDEAFDIIGEYVEITDESELEHLVAAGTPEQIAANPASYTGHFLKEKLQGV